MTLADYKIRKETTLHLRLIFTGGTPITVKTSTGRIITLEISMLNKIRDLKLKIRDQEGIPLGQQILTFSGKHLEDHMLLCDYDIDYQLTLSLVLKPKDSMQIFVMFYAGKIITLDVMTYEDIKDLKLKIQKREGVKPEDQRLIFAGKVLENDRNLIDYNISPQSTLRLLSRGPIQIFVIFLAEKIITLDVDSFNKISDVKLKIQDKEGIEASRQTLYFAGKLLEDNYTLSDHDVGNRAKLV